MIGLSAVAEIGLFSSRSAHFSAFAFRPSTHREAKSREPLARIAIDWSRFAIMTGIMTFSSKLPPWAPIVITASLPITWAAIWVSISLITGFTLPGMIAIMPGKVNPVMSEMLTQIAAQVIGNDAVITIGAQGGNFELNVMIPVMIANLLQSIAILANGSRLFASRCVDGLKANPEKCADLLEKSPISATALNPIIGYERAAMLIKDALKKKASVKQLAIEQGLITKEQADK